MQCSGFPPFLVADCLVFGLELCPPWKQPELHKSHAIPFSKELNLASSRTASTRKRSMEVHPPRSYRKVVFQEAMPYTSMWCVRQSVDHCKSSSDQVLQHCCGVFEQMCLLKLPPWKYAVFSPSQNPTKCFSVARNCHCYFQTFIFLDVRAFLADAIPLPAPSCTRRNNFCWTSRDQIWWSWS